MLWESKRLPLSGHTCKAHNSGRGCHIVPFAWERRIRCSLSTCLLHGSSCPAHASPSVSTDWAHTRRSFASMQSRFEMRPPWLFMYDTTDLLSERTSTWMSGRKNWQAWHTASISRQLMCRPDSFSDQRPKFGLPSHNAPQLLLEASVVTTFLLCAVCKVTPCFS